MKSTTYERIAQCVKGRDVGKATANDDFRALWELCSPQPRQWAIKYARGRTNDLEKYDDPRARIFLTEVARIQACKACTAAVDNARKQP